MSEDWYDRLLESGVMDTLAPYNPVVVGAYPLGIQAPHSRIEIVCRSVDLPAFARVVERTYGTAEGFEMHPGTLDEEDAVFAEFELDGLPLEVAAQPDHVHQRFAAATIGIARMFEVQGPTSQARLEAAVARGEDWLDAAVQQTGLSRAAIEAFSTANPAVMRRVLGVKGPPVPLATYVVPVLLGLVSMTLIVLATAGRGSADFTGLMLLLEAAVLGAVFGTRLGLAAALTPLILIGLVVVPTTATGGDQCDPDCGTNLAQYVFVAVLIVSAVGITGLLRDRYFPRET